MEIQSLLYVHWSPVDTLQTWKYPLMIGHNILIHATANCIYNSQEIEHLLLSSICKFRVRTIVFSPIFYNHLKEYDKFFANLLKVT